jgi:hypothetical protein
VVLAVGGVLMVGHLSGTRQIACHPAGAREQSAVPCFPNGQLGVAAREGEDSAIEESAANTCSVLDVRSDASVVAHCHPGRSVLRCASVGRVPPVSNTLVTAVQGAPVHA